MDLRQEIEKHKSNCPENYQALKLLYLAHGESDSYKRILAHKTYSSPNFEDLLYEVSKCAPVVQLPVQKKNPKLQRRRNKAIAKKKVLPAPVIDKTPPPAPVPEQEPMVDFSNKPEPVLNDPTKLQLEKRKGELYRLYVKLFHDLPLKQTDVERQEPIKRIKAIWDEIYQIWEKLNHFEKHGYWPTVKDTKTSTSTKDLSMADLVAKSRNLPTYISKAKKQRDKATTEATRQKHEEKIQKLTIELQEVNNRLNSL